ncbi:MAG: bifunctional precorrin-2 dehydrogenase/sirohydrochlorin ferrochelatase [Myxococcales bacterium]|nr:bifunctional precorrin-2 dehydrogenase/sirohydrochlorin ferrochelatase [Myxococcales bacterium]
MSPPGVPHLHPLFLKLANRRVLVIGAGPVGERKIASLLPSGARVSVVAPEATSAVRDLAARGVIEWIEREFVEADVEGAWLIFAAAADPEVQRRAAAAAEAARTFIVAVDDPSNASAYSAAVVERAPFTVAISSGGAAPAVTRLLRELIEQILPAEGWVEEAGRLRARWLAEGAPMGDRFAELVRTFAARAGVTR